MGILNVTPDSFSDGGRFQSLDAVASRAVEMVAHGADWLDIGGESTRPGAAPVSQAEEIDRVVPAIEAVRDACPTPVSIDTRKPAVARAAVAAGASLWNDITALSEAPDSLETCAALGCQVVLMHMKGEPRTMQMAPAYDDVVAEVTAMLETRARAAIAGGVAREAIWLDPGIGFGKRLEHNLALLAPSTIGKPRAHRRSRRASRKGFIRELDPGAREPLDRLGGSLAVVLAGARADVAMVRVHDVRQTAQALAVAAAIEAAAHG